jgi:hypothetical protein
MAQFDGPGPGRKQCKACRAYVGVRTAVCHCGHAFPKKADPASPSKPAPLATPPTTHPAPALAPRTTARIYAAPGRCPIAYNGDVGQWAQQLRSLGARSGMYYTVSALGLWLREYVDDLTEWQKEIDKIPE